ncbi:MAG: Gfo/Idh/MocA family oxidoreductase [Bryobacteraceae bacterium]|nr:Gfo/Idh/MocA family oxidoreductase [Bryobacteraceae bacterium]MDW8377964.1 Gfo/Idh/MocA family oxidoreductase [Bryobacterales bacterium]
MLRRKFAKTAAVGVSALSARRVLGANDRVRVGLIGCGGRGRYVARLMREASNVAFPAVADVYDENARQAREWAGADAKQFRDFRRLLELKDIDAVLIATPDHWHAIACVLACEAGKDVYVEKPVALTVREGRAMVNAARKYRRIVQVGTQHRSAPHFQKIARMIQEGAIGKVNFIRVWNYLNLSPNGIGRKPAQPVPPGLDWDMYLGPSPKVDFNPNRFLRTYRYFFDYSGGFITDFGNHRLDTMQQIMGVTAPHTISASGGRFVLQDDGDVPDLLTVTYEYDGFVVTYEGNNLNSHGVGGRTPGHRYYNSRGEWDQPNGIAFYGTDGTIFAERIGWETFPEPETPLRKPARKLERMWENVEEPTKAHAANFIDCVRSRKMPNADIEIGHRSTTVCLLGNIAWKTGKKLKWDAAKEDFLEAPEASALLTRTLRKPWDLIQI